MQYNQQWIRKTDNGFKSSTIKHSMCSACGNNPRCLMKTTLTLDCKEFLPVISFTNDVGLQFETFNTFRRGLGLFRRLTRGVIVRLYNSAIEEFVGKARVTDTHSGPLGPLLDQHAAMNHTMIGDDALSADSRLLQVLVRNYGRNYVQPTSPFSVIYLEPVRADH